MKIHDETRIPEFLKMLDELKNTRLEIGIFGEDDGDMVMIGSVHEFGADITPKKSRFLTIPLNKKAKEKSPRDFDDLFVLHADSGELFLVKEKGKDSLEFYYWLARSVKIPERSFIRAGFDKNKDNMISKGDDLLEQVIQLKLPVDTFFSVLGEYLVGQIQGYLTSLKEPPNSPVTANNKGSSNPLVDTGRLRDSITYKVVRD